MTLLFLVNYSIAKIRAIRPDMAQPYTAQAVTPKAVFGEAIHIGGMVRPILNRLQRLFARLVDRIEEREVVVSRHVVIMLSGSGSGLFPGWGSR